MPLFGTGNDVHTSARNAIAADGNFHSPLRGIHRACPTSPDEVFPRMNAPALSGGVSKEAQDAEQGGGGQQPPVESFGVFIVFWR